MKRITTIICLLILILSFAFMFVFSVFFPRTTESNYSKLKEYPAFSVDSLFSGKYFNDVKDYFTDTIHNRDSFIDFEARIRALYGLKDNGDQLIVIDPESKEDEAEVSEGSDISDISIDPEEYSNIESGYIDESSDAVDSDEESSEAPDESNVVDKFEVDELEDNLIIIGNRIFEIYGGDPDGDIITYAETLNAFAEKVGTSVNVYSMVIPKACSYYLQQAASNDYTEIIEYQRNDLNKISELLSDNVINVDVYNILGRHSSEDIYFRTDHHWTALGAYYASTVMAEKAGVAIDEIDEFSVDERRGFLGSLYSRSNGSTALLNNPEVFRTYYPDTEYTVTYYASNDLKSNPNTNENGFFWSIPDSRKSDWYSTFLNGDNFSIKAVSDECKNGRKLLIVKDSYGNALAPFLIEGFEEIYIVDAREYEISLSKTVEEYGITDVLFAECTFSAAGWGYVKNLKELCK